MEFLTFADYRRAVLEGGVLARGDFVYVSSKVYEGLSVAQRDWLWTSALAARVRLVTDLEVNPPVIVRRGWALGDVGTPMRSV